MIKRYSIIITETKKAPKKGRYKDMNRAEVVYKLGLIEDRLTAAYFERAADRLVTEAELDAIAADLKIIRAAIREIYKGGDTN